MRKPNSIIVLLYIFHIIHPQKQKLGVQPFCFRGEHSKGLRNGNKSFRPKSVSPQVVSPQVKVVSPQVRVVSPRLKVVSPQLQSFSFVMYLQITRGRKCHLCKMRLLVTFKFGHFCFSPISLSRTCNVDDAPGMMRQLIDGRSYL